MKKFILIAIFSALVSSVALGQGSYNFANSVSSLVQIQYWPEAPHAATAVEDTYVEFLWAPFGITDLNLFQVVGTKLQVGIPAQGRFAAGARTIPAGTGFSGIEPGATVNAFIRAWIAPEWSTEWNNRLFQGYSSIFTVDTGDPTLLPPSVPANINSSTATPFTGVIITIPEPTTSDLLILAGLVPLKRRKNRSVNL